MSPIPTFGVQVPTSIEGVPSELLIPENTWEDKAAYAGELPRSWPLSFVENFKKSRGRRALPESYPLIVLSSQLHMMTTLPVFWQGCFCPLCIKLLLSRWMR